MHTYIQTDILVYHVEDWVRGMEATPDPRPTLECAPGAQPEPLPELLLSSLLFLAKGTNLDAFVSFSLLFYWFMFLVVIVVSVAGAAD